MLVRIITIWNAFQMVFVQKKYFLTLAVITFAIFWLFILLPVILVPGNDISFQLSIMPKQDFIILLLLSFLTGISLLFHLYIVKHSKKLEMQQMGYATVSGGMGILSSFLGTITCISCASTVLGFLGIGTVAFALKFRFFLASISVFIMIVSLYFTSRKVLKMCDMCHVKYY